jgi:hypothetical protein
MAKPAARAMNAYAAKREAALAHQRAMRQAFFEGWQARQHTPDIDYTDVENCWQVSMSKALSNSAYVEPLNKCECGSRQWRFQTVRNEWICTRCLRVVH